MAACQIIVGDWKVSCDVMISSVSQSGDCLLICAHSDTITWGEATITSHDRYNFPNRRGHGHGRGRRNRRPHGRGHLDPQAALWTTYLCYCAYVCFVGVCVACFIICNLCLLWSAHWAHSEWAGEHTLPFFIWGFVDWFMYMYIYIYIYIHVYTHMVHMYENKNIKRRQSREP